MPHRRIHYASYALLLAIALAFLFPKIGILFKPFSVYLLMFAVFASLLGVQWRQVIAVPKRELGFAFAVHYLLIPSVAWFISLTITSTPVRVGLLLAAVMPVGISAPAVVKLMAGNFEESLAFAVIFFVLAIAVSPLLLWLLIGSMVTIDAMLMAKQMAQFIIIPLSASLIVSAMLKRYPQADSAAVKASGPVSLIMLFFIVWGVTSGNVSTMLNDPWTGLGLLGRVLVLFFSVFALTAYLSHFVTKRCPNEIALTLLMYKNYVLAAVIALALFGDQAVYAVVVFSIGQNIAVSVWMRLRERYGCFLHP